MEESVIREWLRNNPGDGNGDGSGSGSGYGDGYGSGYGYGNGDGSGDGDGYGSGYGDGYGSGYGDGYGYGNGDGYGSSVKSINGRTVFYIDCVHTFIDAIKGDYAVGEIVDLEDFSTTTTYVAKCNGYFAHGETLKDARRAAEEKWMEDRPLEDRIEDFVRTHPHPDIPYDDLFSWHHILTGSCEQGRREWCLQHGLAHTDEITVRQFVTMTCNDYGRGAIRQLAERYDINLNNTAQ